MKCIGQCNSTTNTCQVCAVYDRCFNKTKALIIHEKYINDLYKKFKKQIFQAATKGNFFTSEQLYGYLTKQIDKQSKKTIALRLLNMLKDDAAFEIRERRVIPIKKS